MLMISPANPKNRLLALIIASEITSPEDFESYKKIRYKVFVVEQKVPYEEEIDKHEDESIHFLARKNDTPCGAARYRTTDAGVKLERFAVLPEFRGQGVGAALVEAVLTSISNNPEASGKRQYLHSQVDAIFLYEKFGFRKTGELFDECGIMHSKMVK